MKRMVVPDALRVIRLAPGRPYSSIGRLAEEFGWRHSDTVARLEAKREARAKTYYSRKKALARKKAAATAAADLSSVSNLTQYGY